MATALASQLRALATAPGRDTSTAINRTRTRPSLLFDPREAADVDLQTVFSIAQAGLEELILANETFAGFQKTLLSVQSTQTDRELETKEFNDKLNSSLSDLLHLLSGYILLAPAHQVFEYLIRRYKIHIYNVDDVVGSILPYHETNIFVRIIQLLKLENTKWEFLSGVKHSGAAPPRHVLVQRCTHDLSFLEAVCDSGISGASLKSVTHITFSCVTVLETASTISSITKEFVNKVLPFILHSLKKGQSDEYQAGGLLIVGVVASRASLTEDLCLAFLEAIAKAASRCSSVPSIRLLLMTMIEVIQTQELDHFPLKALKSVLRVKELSQILADLTETYVADKFLKLFIVALSQYCVQNVDYGKIFCEMLKVLPLKDHLELIVSTSIKFFLDIKSKDLDSQAGAKKILQRPFLALEKRFPVELENCINSLTQEQNTQVFEVLCDVFEGSLRKPLKETRCSFYSSVDNSEVDIRKAAVNHMLDMCQRPLRTEEAFFVSEAIVRRLLDSDLSVVEMVLRIKNLEKHVPLGSLLKCFDTLIHKCMETLLKGPKTLKNEAKAVVKSCLKHMELFETEEGSLKEIQRCVLSYILVKPKTWKLNLQFLKVSSQLPGSFFKGLAKADIGRATEDMLKDNARVELNRKVVNALATVVLHDCSSLELLLDAAATNENAKILCSLVLLKCFSENSDTLLQLSERCFQFFRNECMSFVPRTESDSSELSKIDYKSQLDEAALFQKLEKKKSAVFMEAVLLAMFKMIPSLIQSGETNVGDMFVLFTGSPAWDVFKPHIFRLVESYSGDALLLILEYVFRQDVPVVVRVHSLDVLAWYISDHVIPNENQSLMSLAGSFVCLANPLKSVRVAAISCVKAVKKTFHGTDGGFLKLLQSIADSSENFVNDGKFLYSFCSTFFSEDESDEQRADTMTGLIEQVLKLPLPAQTVYFDVLRNVGFICEKAAATQSTLFQLLERRKLFHLKSSAASPMVLTGQELDLIDKLLELNVRNVAGMLRGGKEQEGTRSHILWALLEALDIEGGSLSDPAVVRPCLLVLSILSPELYNSFDSQFQDKVFGSLIELAVVADNAIRPATIDVIDKLEITVSTISRHIKYLYSENRRADSAKKKKRVKRQQDDCEGIWPAQGKALTVSIGLLEFLLRKTKAVIWNGLLSSLFELLRAHVNNEWPKFQTSMSEGDLQYIGQLILSVIENILRSSSEKLEEHASVLDVNLLVQYINSRNASSRNHALTVITVAGKLYPEVILPHVVEILATVCSSAVIEDDSHSHVVVQEMLESVVPFWLTKVNDPQSLFQVFLEALPTIPAHRQTDLMKCVLRVTNEETSIPTFLLLLLRQAKAENDWSIRFAEKLSMSYASQTRIVAIVKLLTELQSVDLKSGNWVTLQMATRFISDQFQRLEMRLLEGDTAIQLACRTVMEHALQQLQLLGDKKIVVSFELRASCVKDAHILLDTVTKLMSPVMFCEAVAFLLEESDNAIRRRVLQIYISKLKEQDTTSKKRTSENIFTIDANSHVKIIFQISKLLESSDGLSHRTKQAAASALDVAIHRFGDKCSSTFVSCLPAVLINFKHSNEDLVVASVRCTASIISAAGPECLPSLPDVMNNVLTIAQDHQSDVTGKTEFQLSVLGLLEAAVEKLGAFLSPYVEGIIRLIISPEYVKLANTNLAARFASVLTLISENIPARLLLDPLVNSYKHALQTSEASTSAIFQMLATMCSKLDRASVAAYHAKIFKFCMDAFDLRRKHPECFTSVHVVEDSVISAVAALVLKLSETAFRPLFVAVQEWASATVLDGETGKQSIERSIVFYKLVNQLTSKLRSVFVPYFRYLLDECLAILGKTDGTKTSKSKKKKTTHLPAELSDSESSLPKWQLRHLVVSALHKCFTYDTIGFLDSAKFQQLLPPLAGQLLEQVPPQLEASTQTDIPTVAEADEALVSCLGRMALTAGTDALWKPLNHEVLMKTRGDSTRAKLLALSIVKFLSENLKEEYLVLIPETIPFLSELLEDQDMNTVSKTQEVIKMLEESSGESLAQYL